MRIIPKVNRERKRETQTANNPPKNTTEEDCVRLRGTGPFRSKYSTFHLQLCSWKFLYGKRVYTGYAHSFFPSQSLMRPASFSSPLFFLWERAPGCLSKMLGVFTIAQCEGFHRSILCWLRQQSCCCRHNERVFVCVCKRAIYSLFYDKI